MVLNILLHFGAVGKMLSLGTCQCRIARSVSSYHFGSTSVKKQNVFCKTSQL